MFKSRILADCIKNKYICIQKKEEFMFGSFDFQEFLSAFIVLFAVIDIIGSIPIILNLKQKGRNVNANKATGISFLLCRGYDAEVISS